MESKETLQLINSFYNNLLGYSINQTSLEIIKNREWNKFAIQKGLDPNSSGIYFPRNQTSFVKEGCPLSLFHEYFGHGIYCEYSQNGQELVNLEKKLLEQEKQEFQSKKFTMEDVKKFRERSDNFNELIKFKNKHLMQYESFAVWTEYLLSKKFNLLDEFQKKYAFDSSINLSNNCGDLAVFYNFGLKKIQDEKRILNLSKDLFKNSLDKTRLIMHFGSAKEFSDIDLFVLSNSVKSFYSFWIDVIAYDFNTIEEKIKLLDPKVTSPLLSGKFILGEKPYLENLNKKIFSQPITQEAIDYSLNKADYHKKKYFDSSLGKYTQNKNLRSSKVYLTNALALKEGKKILTFAELVNYSRAGFSHSEKFRELKGGIE